jgi:hypothetical protein
MSNPAWALHALLSSWEVPAGASPANARQINDENHLEGWTNQGSTVDLVRQIEFVLAGMTAVGHDVTPYRKAVPRWYAACFSFTNPWMEAPQNVRPAARESDLDLLQALGIQMDTIRTAPPVTAVEISDLSAALESAEQLASEEPTLPDDLRRYVLALIGEARKAISDFDVFGSVQLRRIAVELGGALHVASGTLPEGESRNRFAAAANKLLFFIGATGFVAIANAAALHMIPPAH